MSCEAVSVKQFVTSLQKSAFLNVVLIKSILACQNNGTVSQNGEMGQI